MLFILDKRLRLSKFKDSKVNERFDFDVGIGMVLKLS